MLTLSPPAISCTPEKYTETWHEVFRKEWDDDYKYYDLVYYRPVMLYGAGGTAAVRGLVGNKRSTDSDNCVNEGEGSSSESGMGQAIILSFFAVRCNVIVYNVQTVHLQILISHCAIPIKWKNIKIHKGIVQNCVMKEQLQNVHFQILY